MNKNGVVYMTSPNIKTTHAFTTRIGGVSTGIYDSLNFAQKAGDNIEHVRENYSRLCTALKITTNDIVCSTQVHGTNIRTISRDDCGKLLQKNPHKADALITQSPHVALMVFTADCVPILLYDPVKKVAGAVHAGWRGTVADIAGKTIKKMTEVFNCSPSDIKAAIGPCISKCCFETDKDVSDALIDSLGSAASNCFTKKDSKFMIDLKEANRIYLSKSGLTDISISNECTSCLPDKYWSHRKTKGFRGSQVAIILIND